MGQIDCHLEELAMVVLFAWKSCPKLNATIAFSIMHLIMNSSLLVISDLSIIVWEKSN
jgi:hypothetical protein